MNLVLKSGVEIGYGCKPFVIAEVGSNWKTPEDCLLSIRIAKANGADAVKFQFYSNKALYGRDGVSEAVYQTALQGAWLPELKAHCDLYKIEFMCSAFSPEGVHIVDRFVNLHKVASAEMTHVKLLEAVKATGKPVLLSTGASGEADIREAVRTLGHLTPVILMYCVAAYPAKVVDLGCIDLLKKISPLVGFSDHTIDALIIPRAAIDRGACVIEKHVNFSDHTDTPDAGHALNEREFKGMVDAIHNRRVSQLGATLEEADMVKRHNRRLIATKAIAPGDAFQEGVNFGAYRALKDDLNALSPFAMGAIEGKISPISYNPGDGIGPNAL